MLLAVSEIKNYYKNEGGEDFGHQNEGNKNEVKGNYVSLITSCIFQALLLSFLVLTFLSWMRNKSTCKIDGNCKARELYASITKVPNRCLYEEQEGEGDQAEHPENSVAVPFSIKVARLYYLLFLFKRTIMILIVVLASDSLFVLKIWLLFILQIASMLYALFVRSFASKKDQIVEILNEIVILTLIALLAKYNSKEKWTDASENAFIGIILLQSWVLLAVSTISFIVKFIRFIRICNGRSENPEVEEALDKNRIPKEESKELEEPPSFSNLLGQNSPALPLHLKGSVLHTKTLQDVVANERKQSKESQSKAIW